MKIANRFLAAAALGCVWPAVVAGQVSDTRFEAAVQLLSTHSGEFDAADTGISGRVSWHPVALLGLEAEFGLYPADFPDRVAFSGSRVEGLFGATVGPTLRRVRPFFKVRPGFLAFQEAPEPFACILIFPPPLACPLASGRTVFAMDLGGGLEVEATRRTFVRVDAGDRLVHYEGPVFDGRREVRADGFFGHDLRLAIGGGIKF